LQDGSGSWNGIFVYEYGSYVSQGDEINIHATVAEYFEKTELVDIVEYNILSSGNPLPEAILLTTVAVNQEDYEGVLVQVANAECTDFNPEYGEWLVDDGTGTTMVDDLIYEFVPEIGESYNITSIVDYSYGSFRIEPRYSSDISISSTSQEDVLNISFNLYNFPNPFNPSTTIYFVTTNLHEFPRIDIYNLKGQKIRKLEIMNLKLGINEIIWDGTDSNNKFVSSGIYFYKMKAGDQYSETKRMLLLK